jgi:hypothetical protein
MHRESSSAHSELASPSSNDMRLRIAFVVVAVAVALAALALGTHGATAARCGSCGGHRAAGSVESPRACALTIAS